MSDPIAVICQRCGHLDDPVPLKQVCPDTGDETLESRRCPCPHDALEAGYLQYQADLGHRAATRRARERMIYEKRHGRTP